MSSGGRREREGICQDGRKGGREKEGRKEGGKEKGDREKGRNGECEKHSLCTYTYQVFQQ